MSWLCPDDNTHYLANGDMDLNVSGTRMLFTFWFYPDTAFTMGTNDALVGVSLNNSSSLMRISYNSSGIVRVATGGTVVASTDALTMNDWNFVAVGVGAFDGAQHPVRIYLNEGSLRSANQLHSNAASAVADHLRVALEWANSPMCGMIAELGIWPGLPDTAAEDERVAAAKLYKPGTITGALAPTHGYRLLDDGVDAIGGKTLTPNAGSFDAEHPVLDDYATPSGGLIPRVRAFGFF